jgi:hypothetical protein
MIQRITKDNDITI